MKKMIMKLKKLFSGKKQIELFKPEDMKELENRFKNLENEAVLSRLKNIEKAIMLLSTQIHKSNEEGKLIKELLLHLSTNVEELLNTTEAYEFSNQTLEDEEFDEPNYSFIQTQTNSKPN